MGPRYIIHLTGLNRETDNWDYTWLIVAYINSWGCLARIKFVIKYKLWREWHKKKTRYPVGNHPQLLSVAPRLHVHTTSCIVERLQLVWWHVSCICDVRCDHSSQETLSITLRTHCSSGILRITFTDPTPSWEADSRQACQTFSSRLMCNMRVHYNVYNIAPLVPNVRQLNSVYTFIPCFYKMRFNVVFRRRPLSDKCCHRPLKFLVCNFVYIYNVPLRALWFDHCSNTLWRVTTECEGPYCIIFFILPSICLSVSLVCQITFCILYVAPKNLSPRDLCWLYCYIVLRTTVSVSLGGHLRGGICPGYRDLRWNLW
jgi:hypothetical protein